MSFTYKVLYTHQKTKKSKIWQDGYLKVHVSNRKGVLQTDDLKTLDSLFVKTDQLTTDAELESDKYLITIEHVIENNQSNCNNILGKENRPITEILPRKRHQYANSTQSANKLKKPFRPVFSKHDNKTKSNPPDVGSENHISQSADAPFNPQDIGTENPINQPDDVVPGQTWVQCSHSTDHVSSTVNEAKDRPLFFSPTYKRKKVDNQNLSDSDSDLRHVPCVAVNDVSAVGFEKRTTDDILAIFSSPSLCNADGNAPSLECIVKNRLQQKPVTDSIRTTNAAIIDENDQLLSNDNIRTKLSFPDSRIVAIRTQNTSASPQLPTSIGVIQNDVQEAKFNTKPTRKSKCDSTSSVPVIPAADLIFPSREDVTSKPTPKRQLKIPDTFASCTAYKQTFKTALKEHLNILLFDVSTRYHNTLSSVDVSGLCCTDISSSDVPKCKHGPAKMKVVRKEGKNNGRLFYSCSSNTNHCDFFVWADQSGNKPVQSSASSSKPVLKDVQSLTTLMNSRGVQLYCGGKITRKMPYMGMRNKQSYKTSAKKRLYIVLPLKKPSSFYGKDDLWVISKDLNFLPNRTFIAKSTYYGPNSSSELEILPLCSYSMSNWPDNELCYAIHACNASTELACLDNLAENTNLLNVPVLSQIISLSAPPPTMCSIYNRVNLSCLLREDAFGLAEHVSDTFSLNADQTVALKRIAEMFLQGHANFVTLIHGVFGAGKSYLLATVVLFLIQLFEVIEPRCGSRTRLKLLITSTTNVAVDHVLQTLLDLGYQGFVRVGSLKKIAKRILPYSVHASDQKDQELNELNEILGSELTNQERVYVKKAIENHRLDVNRSRLNEISVVGVTCAACNMPYLQNLKFQVQLLDECSQMLEPLSMLPIARFQCERLVLVGDPKQLSPTIQGSEACHNFSLEMTLFERLKLMGLEPIMLKTQYRCHPSISEICNQMFYDGVLKNGIDDGQRQPILDWLPTLAFCDVNDGCEEIQADGSFSNCKEAEFVSRILMKLIKDGVEPGNVGVITQYKSQVRKISTLLAHSHITSSELKAIQISTVDAFQGAEKEVIVLSCVRTRRIGFIDCPRRTNVALSRAKRHLIIVGNRRFLAMNSVWNGVLEVLENQHGVCEPYQMFMNRL